jgi:hypothetical protein
MTKTTCTWEGDNCEVISDFLGHENFWHKRGVLIVKNAEDIVFIPKGKTVELDCDGNVIGKIVTTKVDPSILRSVAKNFTTKPK